MLRGRILLHRGVDASFLDLFNEQVYKGSTVELVAGQ